MRGERESLKIYHFELPDSLKELGFKEDNITSIAGSTGRNIQMDKDIEVRVIKALEDNIGIIKSLKSDLGCDIVDISLMLYKRGMSAGDIVAILNSQLETLKSLLINDGGIFNINTLSLVLKEAGMSIAHTLAELKNQQETFRILVNEEGGFKENKIGSIFYNAGTKLVKVIPILAACVDKAKLLSQGEGKALTAQDVIGVIEATEGDVTDKKSGLQVLKTIVSKFSKKRSRQEGGNIREEKYLKAKKAHDELIETTILPEALILFGFNEANIGSIAGKVTKKTQIEEIVECLEAKLNLFSEIGLSAQNISSIFHRSGDRISNNIKMLESYKDSVIDLCKKGFKIGTISTLLNGSGSSLGVIIEMLLDGADTLIAICNDDRNDFTLDHLSGLFLGSGKNLSLDIKTFSENLNDFHKMKQDGNKPSAIGKAIKRLRNSSNVGDENKNAAEDNERDIDGFNMEGLDDLLKASNNTKGVNELDCQLDESLAAKMSPIKLRPQSKYMSEENDSTNSFTRNLAINCIDLSL